MILGRGVAVVLAGVLASAAACGNGKNVARRTTTTSEATTTSTLTTAPPTSVQTSTGTTAAAPATAYEQLAAFITSAKEFDAHLRSVARAINGFGPPWHSVTHAVQETVSAADRQLYGLAATLPAGMPPALLQKTLVVHSELFSRRYAMADFQYPLSLSDIPAGQDMQEQERLLRALANGHEAAARFPRDLADLERVARATPPFLVPPPTSRAQAELVLMLRYAEARNSHCNSRGGVIISTAPNIEWTPGEDYGRQRSGQIEHIPFDAEFVRGEWLVTLLVC